MFDRKIAPAFAKEFSFDLPQPEIIPLSNNSNLVWIKELHQEVVKLDFVFRAGKWFEPKIGVAYFTASMLEKGAGSFNAKAIAEVLDQHGAQVEVSAGSDFSSFSVYSVTKNLDKILSVVMEMLLHPTFPEDELVLAKNIFNQNLKVNNEKNSHVASKIFKRNIFGKQHPYGSSIEESDTLDISMTDLNTFFENRFFPFEIYVTGPLKNHQIKTLVDSFSSFQYINPLTIDVHEQKNTTLREKILKPESIQTSIRLGKKTITRSHPDYVALLLVNHILGGYFGSRLMKNIREEKGLTYGISSSIHSHLHESIFSIGTDVNKDKLEIIMIEIQKEITKLRSEPISLEELELSKNHILGNLQLEISNAFSITEKIKNLRLNQLPSDYYTDLFKKIKETNSSYLQKIVNTYLDWETMYEVTVG